MNKKEQTMRTIGHCISNEKGSVIVISLVVLMAISAMGVTLLTLGSSEQDMGTNIQLFEQGFQSSDSCLWMTGKFLHHLYDKDDVGDVSGILPGDELAPGIINPSTVAGPAGRRPCGSARGGVAALAARRSAPAPAPAC